MAAARGRCAEPSCTGLLAPVTFADMTRATVVLEALAARAVPGQPGPARSALPAPVVPDDTMGATVALEAPAACAHPRSADAESWSTESWARHPEAQGSQKPLVPNPAPSPPTRDPQGRLGNRSPGAGTS